MKPLGEILKDIKLPTPKGNPKPGKPERLIACDLCNDAGWVRVSAEPGSPNFGRIIPCVCQKRHEDKRHREKLEAMSNLNAYAACTFETFDQDLPGVAEAYRVAKQYSEDMQGWLLLTGQCGTGKTHLAAAIANVFIDNVGQPALFRNVPDLLDSLRATFAPSSTEPYDERLNMIRDAPLLILDDLGTENATPWATEKLFQILNHRYIEQLLTVITTNHDLGEIEERILSRVLDTRLTRVVSIDSEDFRRRGRPNTVQRGSPNRRPYKRS